MIVKDLQRDTLQILHDRNRSQASHRMRIKTRDQNGGDVASSDKSRPETDTQRSSDHQHHSSAAAAFRSEALLEPVGWALPPIWDSIAGIYAGTDGYVRLHTNYAHHRAAALAALGFLPAESDGGPDRAAVAQRTCWYTGCDPARWLDSASTGRICAD